MSETPKKRLVLHVEVDGFWADDLDECADFLSECGMSPEEARLDVVTNEWMRPEVGLTLVSRPGEKCDNDDFMVRAYNGRIVGAEAKEADRA